MLDKDIKIGEECLFAITTGWMQMNYGIVIGVNKNEFGINIYDIYNQDEDKHYYRESCWIKQK